MSRIGRLLFVIFCLSLAVSQSAAHTRSQSSSSWSVEGHHLRMSFHVDSYRTTLLAAFGWDELSPAQMLARHLPDHISVAQDGITCPVLTSEPGLAAKGKLVHRMTFECGQPITDKAAQVKVEAFFALSATHQHIFYARFKEGQTVEKILTAGQPSVSLSLDAGQVDVRGLLSLGFKHVLSGLDHLLFLCALVMVCRGWRQVVVLITCFTAGHMLSLYLVGIGAVSPVPVVIEALIGLSIAAVAVAALARFQAIPKRAPYLVAGLFVVGGLVLEVTDRLPVSWTVFLALSLFIFLDLLRLSKNRLGGPVNIAVLTLLFSLAHGAGFAGGLVDAGFQETALWTSILLFNVGVEIGQLLAVGGFFLVLSLASRAASPVFYKRGEIAITLTLIWMGSYYFFLRLF